MRSAAVSADDLKSHIASVDADFRLAGLVRSGRVPGRQRQTKESAAAAGELTRPAPASRIAANGVRWIPVPGWKLPWLWSGFSTRQGGVSRAYCPADAPGELNLGFTAGDERAAVVRNRELLAEAIAGDPRTPLVTARQSHSNLVLIAGLADARREQPRKADGLITAEPGLLLAV